MEFFKVLIVFLAVKGGWSLFSGSTTAEDIHKIEAYDSITVINK